jgi:ketosteroid isomerase-like protein
MKSLLRLLPWLAFLLLPLAGAEAPAITAVRRADDARIAASLAGDPTQLGALLSADLNYRHSSGLINDKAALIEHLTHESRYLSFRYEDRNFTSASPDIVLMTGHCRLKSESKGKTNDLHLSFLGVWRREGETWRFLAWQSCNLAPANP